MRDRVGMGGYLRLSWVLTLLLCLAGAGPALAQANGDASVPLVLRGDESPETIKRMLDAIEASGRKVTVRIAGPGEAMSVQPPAATAPVAPANPKTAAAPKAPAQTPTATSNAASRIDEFWESFVAGLDYGNDAIPAAAALPEDWERAWSLNRNGVAGLPAGWRLLFSLTLAVGAALLFRWASRGWFARRLRPAGPEFTPRLIASSYGLVQDLLTIGIALGTLRLCGSLFLPEPDLASRVLRTVGNAAIISAAYVIIGRFLLAPDGPERRLLPLPRAQHHFRLLIVYAIFAPVVVTSAIVAEWVALDRRSVAGLFALTGIAITLFKLWWFYNARHDIKALVLRYSETPGAMLRIVATLTPWIYMAVSVVIWMMGRAAAMMSDGGRWAEAAGLTQIIIVLAPVFAIGAGALLRCRQAHHAALNPQTPQQEALARTGQAAVSGIIWAGSFYLFARLWAGFFTDMGSPEFIAFSRQAASIALLAFGGWVALVFLKAFFDAYTPKAAPTMPGDEDAVHEDHIPSRLATVLPVLRGVVLGAVVGLVGLVVLSRLGVDIGPLLAGFGILGLAISFGSQALVRDIVSGFFFMTEDAFRVGEYVDTGRLRGTVEKISLRSMQLRHQSGQIHTVPFGQIPSLTNASRDWATLKFNVRLDHSADIEKARKTIKKTGLALLEDPEYGPHFIAPLKMQGVADIADTAIVVRLKFTAKPASASMLQREALKRVYRALNEAGVPFASNAVTVRGGEERAGAAAIATVPPPTPLAPAAG
ncbi:mechanosensitive ion channel domain-containing protein [Bosea sp. BK604]|uniref:mechanosensitive ion channel family protein n=1 Tax=Bosea sp. BK604 TaxID=2512180 RepID=UPI0010496298|nr:mechanosensitive ion channel domain-containing protein [Bosea sp. BK604]TCR66484.1 small-conductance mechanosensitive channel [Bosea sp. BK604]